MTPPTAAKPKPRVPLKTVALPNEHGAWALVLEPAALGLLLAPSPAGLALAFAGLAAMMTQHPLALLLTDLRRGKRYPRTAVAGWFAAAYGAIALLATAAAFGLAGELGMFLPLALAAPLALIQLAYDTRNAGRRVIPELAGVAAVGALASAVALAAGWDLVPALLLWLIMLLRSLPSIVWVRTRLALAYGREADRRPALAMSAAAVAVAAALAFAGAIPAAVLLGASILAVRAAWGVSHLRGVTTPQGVGMRELAFGAAYLLVAAAGYVWGV